ncbi:PREDICTED: lactosylceramide 4-alpha-galactosyltransferase-like isoform X2 [Papilio xuthus]|uniref:Lactosylceramide 4-alpha-galactosyltransferase-like isoform X2 n=1 Tax=Papilio xuthus TaxID=66420 RepID=A0AAJ6ZGD7_PAPXU|nr:PREDICTED: lactosylceramide 4-alpha-galactosyltransferase-like isoform X2 [Papilio xuthus]
MFNYVKILNVRCQKIAASVILIILCVCFLHKINNSKYLPWAHLKDISCYYSVKGDVLPSADSNNFSPSQKSIFFMETSCRRNLTSRDLCAIESAARAHPDYRINVLFAAPISAELLGQFSLRQKFENVRFARIHIDEYSKNTPVQELVWSGGLYKSHWRVEHASDLLRYLTLYKFGGIYLDLDVVVAKRLDTLAANWAARESEFYVGSSAIAFSLDSVGRSIAEAAISDLQNNFRHDLWSHNGPGVITRVLKMRCNTTDITLMNSKICQGFEVYGPELFYPINWQNGRKYFEPGILENKDAYIYHVWSHMTRNRRPDSNSPYSQLARTFCPFTYTLYGDQFGL